MTLYDLRDPSYVPPHLRDGVPHPLSPGSSADEANDAQRRLDYDLLVTGIGLLALAGLFKVRPAGSDPLSGWELAPAYVGCTNQELRDIAIGVLSAMERRDDARLLGRVGKPVRKGPPDKYPFSTMGLGERFTVPVPVPKTFRVYCSKRGESLGRKFACRKLESGAFEVERTA